MTNKELAQRWFRELWGERKPEVIAELLHPNGIGVSEAGEIHGPESFRRLVYDALLQAFPDLKISAIGFVAEGDEVMVRWLASGTHKGALGDLPPSGRAVQFEGKTWMRFQDGRIIEGSDSYNLHSLVNYLSMGTSSATVKAMA